MLAPALSLVSVGGYEPQYWWWDIIVKRLDVGLMKLTTYTSMAADEKLDLFWGR